LSHAPTTTGPPTTADAATGVSGDAAVLAAYRAFWDAYLAAANPMNPTNPVLAEHAAGQELVTLQKAFLAGKDAGQVIRGTFDLAPKVTSVQGPTATVSDCYGDNTHVYNASTGAQLDSSSGVRHLVIATLQLFGTQWRVTDLHHEADGCTHS
jgi:hypothetical protein